jgi:hypothetical protein
MLRALIAISLSLALFSCDGELVTADTWPSNRTIDREGGSLYLRELLVTIPRDAISDGAITFRITEEEIWIPGALSAAYRVLPEGISDLKALLTWRIHIEDLPQGVYFVDLAVARAVDGEWVPLADTSPDPITGQVSGATTKTGIFALISQKPL